MPFNNKFIKGYIVNVFKHSKKYENTILLLNRFQLFTLLMKKLFKRIIKWACVFFKFEAITPIVL